MREWAATDDKVEYKLIDPLEGHTMMKFIKNFGKNEDGAVTVDWVVLTAAVVGLAIAAFTAVETGTTGLTKKAADNMVLQDASTTAIVVE